MLKLIIATNDLRELKLRPLNENERDTDEILNDLDQCLNAIDDVISFLCANFLVVYPSVTIK
jgi:hypothetical protein